MSHEVKLKRLRLESLNVTLLSEIREDHTYNILERSKIQVTAYRFNTETGDFALSIDLEYTSYGKQDNGDTQDMVKLNSVMTALCNTNALSPAMTEAAADTLIKDKILSATQELCETAIHIKLREILRGFSLNTALPLGRATFELA